MVDNERLGKIEQKEKQILEEERKIEAAEERIAHEEKHILSAEQAILKSNRSGFSSIFRGGLDPTERYFLRKRVIKRFARHKLLFSLLVTIGVVLVWRGIWHTADALPIISLSLVSFVVGIAVLWLIDQYTDIK